MSCGDPHETDCSEVLNHLYEYLDRELSATERSKFEEHFGECNPCLEKYGLEQAVKKLVKRCCGHDDVPGDLRAKVMTRIQLIRSGEAGFDTEYPAGVSGTGHSGPDGSAPASPGPADASPADPAEGVADASATAPADGKATGSTTGSATATRTAGSA